MTQNFLFILTFFCCIFGCTEIKKSPDFFIAKLTTNVTSSLRGLSVVDSKTVWASGSDGTILLSSDGGENWNNVSIKGEDSLDFRDIEALDEKTALVISAGYPCKIFKTNDGGISWNEKYSNYSKDIFFNSFSFYDSLNGIAVGDPINNRFMLIKTEDGGNSWNEFSLQSRPDAANGEIQFAASGMCIDFYSDSLIYFATGGSVSNVYKSVTGGNSWTIHKTPLTFGSNSRGIFAIKFITEKSGFIIGGDYKYDTMSDDNFAYTLDGGNTWRKSLIPPTGFKSAITTVLLEDHLVLVSTGTSGFDYSLDTGKTWIHLSPIASNTIDASKDSPTLFSIDSDGNIYKISVN